VLHGSRYANDRDVKDVVYTWLCTQLKLFFVVGIRKVDQSNKCMKKMEDYNEKKTVYFLLCTFCRMKKVMNCPYFLNTPPL